MLSNASLVIFQITKRKKRERERDRERGWEREIRNEKKWDEDFVTFIISNVVNFRKQNKIISDYFFLKKQICEHKQGGACFQN